MTAADLLRQAAAKLREPGQPPYAKPLADWLNETAGYLTGVAIAHGHITGQALTATAQALRTARAILGEEADR